MEIVLVRETEEKFEIKKPIALPQKRIIYDDRSVGFTRPPALVASRISQRHGVGHKPRKVLGQGRVADLSVQVRDVLTGHKQEFGFSQPYCGHKGSAANRNQLLHRRVAATGAEDMIVDWIRRAKRESRKRFAGMLRILGDYISRALPVNCIHGLQSAPRQSGNHFG